MCFRLVVSLFLLLVTRIPSASAVEYLTGIQWQEPPVITPGAGVGPGGRGGSVVGRVGAGGRGARPRGGPSGRRPERRGRGRDRAARRFFSTAAICRPGRTRNRGRLRMARRLSVAR